LCQIASCVVELWTPSKAPLSKEQCLPYQWYSECINIGRVVYTTKVVVVMAMVNRDDKQTTITVFFIRICLVQILVIIVDDGVALAIRNLSVV
jgi:hypothetical protein